MNDEPKRRGRPPKNHLQDDHHFKASDDLMSSDVFPLEEDESGKPVDEISVSEDIPEPVKAIVEAIEKTATIPVSEKIAEMESNVVTGEETPVTHSMAEHKRVLFVEPQSVEVAHGADQLNGWNLIDSDILIKLPPRNGLAVKVSETPSGAGVVVYWRRLRAFANATKRWQENGCWCSFHTGQKIDFEPKYWKDRF